jgi:peptidyl-prolyl cis-trans isomerase B (cyclophilin B)
MTGKKMVMLIVAAVLCLGMAMQAGASDASAKKGEATKAEKAVQKPQPAFKTEMDKISYAIGQQIGNGLKSQKLEVDLQLLLRGIEDALEGAKPALTPAEQQQVMRAFQKKQQEKMMLQREKMKAQRKAEALAKMKPEDRWKLNLKQPAQMTFDVGKKYYWILQTNKGTIKIKLMPEAAPMHVTSTIFLTNKGYYDNLKFHRVIPGFMAQGGCPVGNGEFGPGYEYAGEFDPKVKHDRPYLLSMANAGPGTDGSQFFLTFKATPWLDGKHTIFGEIVEGKDVMAQLEAAGTPSGKPKEDLVIEKATIEIK